MRLSSPSPAEAACGTARSQRINTGKGGKKPSALGKGKAFHKNCSRVKSLPWFQFHLSAANERPAAPDRTAGGSAALNSLRPGGARRAPPGSAGRRGPVLSSSRLLSQQRACSALSSLREPNVSLSMERRGSASVSQKLRADEVGPS